MAKWFTGEPQGYTEQPRRMRCCTTAPAGIHSVQGRRCHWTNTLPRHHTCADTHPSSFLPPIKDFSPARVSWAVPEQIAQGPDPWGFLQLGHVILHPYLWGLGTVCKCPRLSLLHHLWEPPGKEAIIQCWTWCVGLERRTNEWMSDGRFKSFLVTWDWVSNPCLATHWQGDIGELLNCLFLFSQFYFISFIF